MHWLANSNGLENEFQKTDHKPVMGFLFGVIPLRVRLGEDNKVKMKISEDMLEVYKLLFNC